MKVYDTELGQKVKMHDFVYPDNEKEIVLNEPESFEQIYDYYEGSEDDD